LPKRNQTQTFHILEVFSIAGQQWQVIYQGNAGDQAVGHSDGDAAPRQPLTDVRGPSRFLAI
jgi:hypothetical protein